MIEDISGLVCVEHYCLDPIDILNEEGATRLFQQTSAHPFGAVLRIDVHAEGVPFVRIAAPGCVREADNVTVVFNSQYECSRPDDRVPNSILGISLIEPLL